MIAIKKCKLVGDKCLGIGKNPHYDQFCLVFFGLSLANTGDQVCHWFMGPDLQPLKYRGAAVQPDDR